LYVWYLCFGQGSGSFGGVEIPQGPGDIGHYWQSKEHQDGRDKMMLENCFGIICGDYCASASINALLTYTAGHKSIEKAS